ncbi:LysM peptidoglycan-binding domain-containing M23 family metallopeptidase [Pelagibius marinus]|uniref:LysM peptidoglycan-binding domain-containing M23 family metallopeptidase n=1 Tax=Pelagibius marinus TaxID=2762760 RepID=UPI001D04D03A|nr:LysM peptidoglycan-binding domain-containing M23 family metallopeptidase [Pelagibius marinus]
MAPAALAAAALLLAGCFATPDYRPVGFVTPKDPPALPQRKPPPPADLAAWDLPVETAAAQPAAAVDVQELAPLPKVGQQALAPQPVAKPLAAAQPQPVQQVAATTAAAPAGGRYVVAKGDSLYGIARRFGLPIRAVIDANALQPPYALTIGQQLTIPQAQVHEVVAGDTVFNIARRYNIDRSELVRLNGIQPPYSIPLGQKLILPTPDSAAGAEATAVAYAPPPAAAPAAPTVASREATPPEADREAMNKGLRKPPRSKAETQAALANPPARAGSSFHWPVQGRVLSSFGAKKGGEHNDGINIAAPRGTPVRAAENGVVAYAGEELKGFGKLLLVKHAGGWVTAYAHNEELLVAAGDRVVQGQTIARVGSSGHVERPQLHFEVRRGTRAVNPETQLAPRTASAAN